MGIAQCVGWWMGIAQCGGDLWSVVGMPPHLVLKIVLLGRNSNPFAGAALPPRVLRLARHGDFTPPLPEGAVDRCV